MLTNIDFQRVISTKNNKALPLSECVASFLRHELKQRGITQEQFAEKTGYSSRQIRRWLNGDIKRIENIDEIAKALNVEIRDIVSFGNDIPDSHS